MIAVVKTPSTTDVTRIHARHHRWEAEDVRCGAIATSASQR